MANDFAALKPFFLMLYASYGVACLCLAGAPGQQTFAGACRAVRARTFGTILVAFAALFLLIVYVGSQSFLLVDAALVAPLVLLLQPGARQASAWTIPRMIGLPAVGVIVLSLVWWRITPTPAMPLPLAAFAIILSIVLYGLSDPERLRPASKSLPMALFVVAGLGLMLDLGTYRVGETALMTLAHHWGAFIGPVIHIKAGLVPLYDVPLQYGLGPAMAVAATCGGGSDCWAGAQAIFNAASLLSGGLLLTMALATTTPRGGAWTYSVTLVIFAAVFLWAGFPADGNTFAAYPSVAGIRFLPPLILAALLFFGRTRAAFVMMVPALLWSPESAAMSCVLFGFAGTAQFGFFKSTLLTAGLLAGSYGALFLVHRAFYGVWMDPAALIEYVLHVPGPLPIDPFSDIMMLATMLGLGGWLIFRAAPNPRDARRDLVATALLFGTTSYCLGRSHPNNICNMAPFMALVALRALDRAPWQYETVRRASAFGLAVSVAALAFAHWEKWPPYPIPPLTDIDAVVATFKTIEPDVARIRAQIPPSDGLGIADFGPAYIRHPSETIVWTPMDPSSLWSYVPSERRRVYIARSARKLKRAGWAIVIDRQRFMLDDLASAYTVTDKKSFIGAPEMPGGPPTHYTVACFTPKPDVGTLVGPACPSDWTAKDAISGE